MHLPQIPRCPEAGHDGGGERWLISYADMITLLLVLFIILYSTAQQDLAKFQALSQSLSEGFGASTPDMAPNDDEHTGGAGDNVILDKSTGGDSSLELFAKKQTPIQIFRFASTLEKNGALRKKLEEMVKQAVDEVQAGLKNEKIEGEVTVHYTERGIVIEIHPDQILFDPGSAELKPGFRRILKVLALQFAQIPNQIEVQGHSDSQPIHTEAYPSNWELSAARAGSVVRYLEQLGLDPGRLLAAGYADTHPVGDNSTAEGRAHNRRVEIVILRGDTEETGKDLPVGPEPPLELPAEEGEGHEAAAEH